MQVYDAGIKIQEKAFDLNVLYEIWLTEGRNQKEQREICHFARAHICKICKIAASNWGYINVRSQGGILFETMKKEMSQRML